MVSPHPAALADILPAFETLFPLPAAAHDAACAAVAASLAEGAPLVRVEPSAETACFYTAWSCNANGSLRPQV